MNKKIQSFYHYYKRSPDYFVFEDKMDSDIILAYKKLNISEYKDYMVNSEASLVLTYYKQLTHNGHYPLFYDKESLLRLFHQSKYIVHTYNQRQFDSFLKKSPTLFSNLLG